LWTKKKNFFAVNFELPVFRIADDDLISFIFEHLDIPDSDIQARWQLEPDRVQRCRQRALKRLCRDTDDVSVVRFIRDHEHRTRDQVCSVIVIDNGRLDRCLARTRLFPLSESSVREYIRQNPFCGATDLLAQFSLSRSEYEACYRQIHVDELSRVEERIRDTVRSDESLSRRKLAKQFNLSDNAARRLIGKVRGYLCRNTSKKISSSGSSSGRSTCGLEACARKRRLLTKKGQYI